MTAFGKSSSSTSGVFNHKNGRIEQSNIDDYPLARIGVFPADF